jgi:hypothetical protein
MTGPPAGQPAQTDPGGLQARADGQRVEVRTYEGELIRIVPRSIAQGLIEGHLADNMKHCVRLKLGIRWLPPRFDRPSGRPDLNQMERRDADRYASLWRGKLNAHIGKGAVGRSTIDRSVRVSSLSSRI